MKIYSAIKTKNSKEIKILGINIYSKISNIDYVKRKYLYGLFKKINNNQEIKYYILGIKVYSQKKYVGIKETERIIILKNLQKMISTAALHKKSFAGYKGCHTNKKVCLFGAGPSLKYYVPLQNNKSINVAVNRTFLYDKVKFDYIFFIDKLGVEEYYNQLMKYDCTKFIGNQDCGSNFQVPESIALKMNGIRYNTTANMNLPNKLTYDISSEPICNYRTVSLQALQFILYTNPKRVYIIGNDCNNSTGGHFIGKTYDIGFRGENLTQNDEIIRKSWKDVISFTQTYYPETEIVSVNPVGLKGLFRDVYTKPYIEAHPEILEEEGAVQYFEDECFEEELCD